MAIITEQPDSSHKKVKPSNPNPFIFWFYFTISISILTVIFITVSNLTTQQDPKTWFLALPTNLRNHYSNGKIIKVQLSPHSDPVEVFTIQDGPIESSHNVLIVHGLGCSSYAFSKTVKILGKMGLNAVAIDLPGSGFSDKFEMVTEEKVITGFGRVLEMYNEIKEKGIFWGFDQLVEQGYVNYDHEENEIRVSKVEILKPIGLGHEETGRVLGQVIDAMGLSPVNLVLHDSAFNLGANWVYENLGLISSVTLLDSASTETAFPLWVLKLPVVRELVTGFSFVFEKVVRNCCLKNGDSESHRLLLKGRNGIKSVVETGNRMNSSFDIGEWGKLNGVNNLPMQVIWSEDWIKKGQLVVDALPHATFVTHSGGYWPQEDSADELAKSIHEFVSRLPKPVKVLKKKEVVLNNNNNIHEMVDDERSNGFGGQEVAYPSGYGLEL